MGGVSQRWILAFKNTIIIQYKSSSTLIILDFTGLETDHELNIIGYRFFRIFTLVLNELTRSNAEKLSEELKMQIIEINTANLFTSAKTRVPNESE
ncbi:unnamed protein product [Rhizophagus irregularis]|nr:unnamed protein product [Rhizophagus irregularis]